MLTLCFLFIAAESYTKRQGFTNFRPQKEDLSLVQNRYILRAIMTENIQGLIADIGGTNARFALIIDGSINNEIILKCDSYSSIDKAIHSYFDQVGIKEFPKKAAIAIACPVVDDHIEMTNYSWAFSKKELKKKFQFSTLTIMNDFEAIAYAMPFMDDESIEKIGGGEVKPKANKVVIGPGTGLGAAYLIANDDGSYRAIAGEGGHVTMAARTQREFDIFQYLDHHKYSHVSGERVCSGKGLLNLYDTIRILDKKMNLPALLPEDITAKAMARTCEVCKESLDLMVRFLGRLAANKALCVNAFGGVYIAGGIAPQLIDYIKHSDFREEYWSKGRFKNYMRSIPTYIVTHPYPAFEGLKQEILN